MSIIYDQILNSLTIVKDKDKLYTRTELISIFQKMLFQNNYFVITSNSVSKLPIDVIVKDRCNNKYRLVVYFKNITGAGWIDKPSIKRVQIKNVLSSIDDNKSNTKDIIGLMFVLGYYNYDNNPVFVAWDIHRYGKHNTNRSCYVSISNILRGYENGYFEGVSINNKVWVFKQEFFSKFINKYVEYCRECNYESIL